MYLSDELILKGENDGDKLVVYEDTPDFTEPFIKFNDKATEVYAKSGNWELFEHTKYEGGKIIICEGNTFDSAYLKGKNFKNYISSVQIVKVDADVCPGM